jgi:hypothetical protein
MPPLAHIVLPLAANPRPTEIRKMMAFEMLKHKARGKHCGRRFEMTPKKIRLLQKAMRKREKFVANFAADIGISKATAYRYVGPNGEPRADARRLLAMKGNLRINQPGRQFAANEAGQ